MANPPGLAEAALIGPSTELVRRIEIYESDGTTRWQGGSNDDRLIEGAVGVDYSRDERRTLDTLVLDNSDGALVHSPSAFWYDKVIKVFCGVKYIDTSPIITHDIRTNLAQNPRSANNTTGYAGAGTLSRLASGAGAPEGFDSAARLTFTTSTATANGIYYVMPTGGDEITGKVSAMIYGRVSKSQRMRTLLYFYDDIGLLQSHSLNEAVYSANTWYDLKVEDLTPPLGTTRVLVGFYGITGTGSSLWANGDTVDITGVQIENRSSIFKRFDGDTLDFANRKYSWLGTPHASPSIEDITVETPAATPTSWETQIGEFMIDSISESHFPYIVKVNGRDYTKKCMLDKYSVATSYAAGTPIETAIKVIAQNAGITKFFLPVTTHQLGKDYFFERGVSRWEAMKQIADAFGYELFFNAYGVLVMREFLDPVTSPTSFTLQTGFLGNLVTYEKSLNDSRIYNYIVVTGEASEDVTPVYATAVNSNPTSPTRVAKLGKRVYQYTSSFITTTQQAQDVANRFLQVHGLEEFDLNFDSINLFWMEVGEIVEFDDPRPAPEQPDRFLLSSLTIPLGLGPMSGNAKRVSVVS